jgi:hypothetical protein
MNDEKCSFCEDYSVCYLLTLSNGELEYKSFCIDHLKDYKPEKHKEEKEGLDKFYPYSHDEEGTYFDDDGQPIEENRNYNKDEYIFKEYSEENLEEKEVFDLKKERKKLINLMNEAVKEERFLDASDIRDKIKRLNDEKE